MANEKWSQQDELNQLNENSRICVIHNYNSEPKNKLISIDKIDDFINYYGNNNLIVKSGVDETENANKLQEYYNKAKTMPRYVGVINNDTPASNYYEGQIFFHGVAQLYFKLLVDVTNATLSDIMNGNDKIIGINNIQNSLEAERIRVNLIVYPGIYDFGENTFTIDTPFINIISLTGNADVYIKSNEYLTIPYPANLKVTTGNIHLKGLNAIYKSSSFMIDENLNGLICDTCVGGEYSFGGLFSNENNSFTLCGTFINCIGGSFSFGYTNEQSTINITNSTFINCNSGTYSFGRGWDVNVTGSTFINVTGDDYSFCTSNNLSLINESTFKNCSGGNYSFGSGGDVQIINSKLYNCTAKLYSFGTDNGTISTTLSNLYYCIKEDAYDTAWDNKKYYSVP